MTSRLDVSSLGAYIREQREAAEVSLRQLAKASGVSNPYLSQVERGLRRPSAEILGQIARALRISAETLYVQAGLLEERPDDTGGVAAAIAADPTLTDRQRGLLLEIYASFQAENAAGSPTDPEEGAGTETPPRRSSSRSADRPVATPGRSRRPA